ncbi:NAD-dependent epimerase/dehydratase family protein [Microbulbifer sp. OS29]|uniref:NAD-dependent epimerase/dehydratase family protein n=1 Tax=Microbulbifer okhotskensis TaxID=2926617 RepID=A0A9X2ELF9_9GAMM|nr:NAD-dependent epimerase/dehydratase family protein [Microbulbifer okhotskensis]MCO1334412.1 NAD-dependent epimerase/dehydratase family protein [Microbulbifer okhotskensis]
MARKAIIIGATGLIGRHLTEQLASENTFAEIHTLTRRPLLPTNPKVHNHVVNFEQLGNFSSLFEADTLFSCLGTTLKQAGSLAAQYQVDVEYQYQAATLAAQAGVRHYLLVSSSGANPKSFGSYLRIKGELEEKIKTLPFEQICILQPSLLLGNRNHFRPGEQLSGLLLPLLCRLPGLQRFRPIAGAAVAAKMVRLSQQEGKGIETFSLDQLFTP